MSCRYGHPAYQRGAATILATIFLVVSLSLMVIIVLNMAGSDINDTAMNSDAVEALFIAETGIEHASYLYANGTACLSLAGSSDTIGRGDFTITGAQLVGGNCRVRVEGTVSQTHAVKRTIDADLRLNTGSGVFAVGNGGTILQWGGSSWNTVASGTGQDLTGIDCPTGNYCMAVTSGGTILEWDGTAWSTQAAFGIMNFSSVACLDNNPASCYTTGLLFGFLDVIEYWNGTGWSDTLPFFTVGRNYQDVTCSTTACYVVSAGSSGRIERAAGGGWNWEATANNQLNGISCTSDDICWAVGNRINGPNAYAIYGRNAAGNWFSSSLAANPSRDLHALDCYAPDQCWAVGARNGNSYTMLRRNGAGWALATPALGSAQDLHGISCISSGECWAVGDSGRTLYWDGSSWTAIASGVNTQLNDVFFLGGGGSGVNAVSLIYWQEVVL